MNKKIMLMAIEGLLGAGLLSTWLVKNNVFASITDSKTKVEFSKEENDNVSLTNLKATLTKEDVVKLVLDKYKDGVITEVDLENEDGNIIYEIEINTNNGEHDIKVDAIKGNILVDELDD